jgi:hypothetical protein
MTGPSRTREEEDVEMEISDFGMDDEGEDSKNVVMMDRTLSRGDDRDEEEEGG